MITQHIVVETDPTTAFQAVRGLDLLTVRTPLVIASMWLRGLPDRLAGAAPAPPPRLVIGDGVGLPGWSVLGESDSEIVFGAVGQFWQPVIEWRDVAPEEFADFTEPGWGKIAASLSVLPYGDRSLVSYECRTLITDVVSRRRFRRYWWLIRPFVAHIMAAAVQTIKGDAEDRLV